jgi:hypothetical protein
VVRADSSVREVLILWTCGTIARPAFPEVVRHEREISNAGRYKLDFAERDKCKPVLLRLSLAGNLEKPLRSLYGTEWRELGYGLCGRKGKEGRRLKVGKSNTSVIGRRNREPAAEREEVQASGSGFVSETGFDFPM